ncbi:MAG: repressor LexA [Clostridium sp.]|jgi:repressor LexA|nr:repressor LexA [Clostridium sp.]
MVKVSVDFNFLTSKQKKVYTAIESFIKENGMPPTVREIGELIGEKTPGAVQGILNRLEEKGVIRRQPRVARSIQLVQENSNYADHAYLPLIKKISERNVDDLFNMYNIVKYYPVPAHLFENAENHFIIKCPDNSLLDSGITYEDTLIVNIAPELNDGDIILLMYENLTILRYYSPHEDPDKVILKADSDLIGKEVFGKDEIKIIGKLVAKFSKY